MAQGESFTAIKLRRTEKANSRHCSDFVIAMTELLHDWAARNDGFQTSL
jgi:hypothetical protein